MVSIKKTSTCEEVLVGLNCKLSTTGFDAFNSVTVYSKWQMTGVFYSAGNSLMTWSHHKCSVVLKTIKWYHNWPCSHTSGNFLA